MSILVITIADNSNHSHAYTQHTVNITPSSQTSIMSSNALPLTAAQRDHIKNILLNMLMSLVDMLRAHAADEQDIRDHQIVNGQDEDSDDEVPAEYHGTLKLQEIGPEDTYATIDISFSWEMDPVTKEAVEDYILERIVTEDVPESVIKFTWSVCDVPREEI